MKGLGSLFRMVRRRWWIVLLMAVLGAAAAYSGTNLRNSRIQPSYEARAIVPFEASDSQRDRNEATAELRVAADEAAELTARYIDERLGLVSTDDRASQIVFTTRGPDEATAVETATAMRLAYLEGLDARMAADRQERLDEIVTEAAAVLAQIEALDPPEVVEALPDVDPEVQARLDELVQLANALTQQRTRAEVDLVLAETGDERAGTPEEIQEELDAVAAKLDDIYKEIAAIAAENGIEPPRIGTQQQTTLRPETTLPSSQPGQNSTPPPLDGAVSSGELADQWTIEALQERYDTLGEEYSSFFVEVEDTTAELAAVEAIDVSPQPGSPILYAFVGLIAGALLAIGALFAEKTVRGHIYAASDVGPIPVLAELPAVSFQVRNPDSRRHKAAVGARLEGIRRLRSMLLAYGEESAKTPAIGLSGVGVGGEQVRMLMLDVAHRLAASDRSVVLIDLDFALEYAYEDSVDDVSIAGLLSAVRENPKTGLAPLDEAMKDAAPGKGAMHLIRSGRTDQDPTDLVLTEGLRTLTDRLRDHADLILIVLPDAADSLTKTVSRRFEGMIAVCSAGKSRRSLLANVIPNSAVGGSQAVGVALLVGKHAHVASVRSALDDPPRPDGAAPDGEDLFNEPVLSGNRTDSGPAALAQTRSEAPQPAPAERVSEPVAAPDARPSPAVRADQASRATPSRPGAKATPIAPVTHSSGAEEPQPERHTAVEEPVTRRQPSIVIPAEPRKEPRRVKRALDRLETVLEPVIAVPGPAVPPLPQEVPRSERPTGQRSRIGQALDRLEDKLANFIAPADPTPGSGGWPNPAEDRS